MDFPSPVSIQRFSLHDGPGVRTTLFFQGCPLHCLWCHNPEKQAFTPSSEGDTSCLPKTGSLHLLMREIEKDRLFYDQSGGGVTLSGGEALAQDINVIEALARMLHSRGITLVVDTCGDIPYDRFVRIIPFTQWFLYDIKLMNPSQHKKYTGQSNDRILDNLHRLSQTGANINLRLVLLDGINAELENMEEIHDWLQAQCVDIQRINLLPYHRFGEGKRERQFPDECHDFSPPSPEKLLELKTYWMNLGYCTNIGGGWISDIPYHTLAQEGASHGDA